MQPTKDRSSRIIVLPGEPAGIGIDLVIKIAQSSLQNCEWIVIGDPACIAERAHILGASITIKESELQFSGSNTQSKQLCVFPKKLSVPVKPGQPLPDNAEMLLASLDLATENCLQGSADAIVTGPIQKSIINDAGIAFTGHTEYLAKKTASPLPVMMLANSTVKVCLLTTHIPIREIVNHISTKRIIDMVYVIQEAMQKYFSITSPRIVITGLNPHAGENGYLGDEEKKYILPAIQKLCAQGILAEGPVPADTAFTKDNIASSDVIVAMYHDQGLAPIKAIDFFNTVNITLGLPIIRTSVDHGTALDLAGSGQVNGSSMQAAIKWANQIIGNLPS